MRLAAGLLATALTVGTGLLVREPVPLTKPSVRAMPAQVLTRRLFGDLGRIMLPNFWRGRPGVPPSQPLRRLEFMTVPRAVDWEAGLCQSSWVTVEFEPAGPPRGALTVVRPSRVNSSTGYFAAELRQARDAAQLDDTGQVGLDRLCRRIDPRERNLFSARDPQLGRQGLRLIYDLVEAARANRLRASLDCTHMMPASDPPLTAEGCVQTIARFDPDRLAGVEDCGAEPAYPPNCYLLSIQTVEVRVRLGAGRAIEQVSLEQMIVTGDTIRD